MTSHTNAHIKSSRRRMLLGAGVLILGTGLALACTKSDHAADGDTGAAAPATVRDMSATPQAGDSTAGVSKPTGQPGVAGDTMGSRAVDTAKKKP